MISGFIFTVYMLVVLETHVYRPTVYTSVRPVEYRVHKMKHYFRTFACFVRKNSKLGKLKVVSSDSYPKLYIYIIMRAHKDIPHKFDL